MDSRRIIAEKRVDISALFFRALKCSLLCGAPVFVQYKNSRGAPVFVRYKKFARCARIRSVQKICVVRPSSFGAKNLRGAFFRVKNAFAANSVRSVVLRRLRRLNTSGMRKKGNTPVLYVRVPRKTSRKMAERLYRSANIALRRFPLNKRRTRT